MISVIFWGIWRRLYGWGEFKKILSRTVQTIIAICVLTIQLSNGDILTPIDNNLLQSVTSLLVSVWVIIQYWSRAVGEIIDAGLNPCQGRKEYDRWFRVVCNWIVSGFNWISDKLHLGVHIRKYYGVYDWIYSGMRNLVGVLPAMIIFPQYNWWILVVCMYPIYLFWYWVFDKCPSMYTNKLLEKITLNEPKNWAEVCQGMVFGGVL